MAIITAAEVIGAVGLDFFVMYVRIRHDIAFSIVIAAMSTAIAPAATLMVMKP